MLTRPDKAGSCKHGTRVMPPCIKTGGPSWIDGPPDPLHGNSNGVIRYWVELGGGRADWSPRLFGIRTGW